MKVHLIDTHLLAPRSRSSANVKVKYPSHVSQKMGVLGALVSHKHILFCVIGVHRKIEADLNHRFVHLTLSQTTNFGLFQTERVCRQQFQI